MKKENIMGYSSYTGEVPGNWNVIKSPVAYNFEENELKSKSRLTNYS